MNCAKRNNQTQSQKEIDKRNQKRKYIVQEIIQAVADTV